MQYWPYIDLWSDRYNNMQYRSSLMWDFSKTVFFPSAWRRHVPLFVTHPRHPRWVSELPTHVWRQSAFRWNDSLDVSRRTERGDTVEATRVTEAFPLSRYQPSVFIGLFRFKGAETSAVYRVNRAAVWGRLWSHFLAFSHLWCQRKKRK